MRLELAAFRPGGHTHCLIGPGGDDPLSQRTICLAIPNPIVGGGSRQEFSLSYNRELHMLAVSRLIASVAGALALVTLTAMAADDTKPIDEGKGSAFHSKAYEIKDDGEIAVVLSFEAGKEVTVTTSADRETDVHLMVKGKYFEAKDTSPGPECRVKFTPAKGDSSFKFTVKNHGPGANRVTLKVKVDD
jgi:hypothetical protein